MSAPLPPTPLPAPERPTRPGGKTAVREPVILWAVAFAAIAITRAIPPTSQYAKAVAAVGFLYLPGLVVWRRDEDYRDYGATLKGFGRGLAWGLGISLLVLGIFVPCYFGFLALLPHLPHALTWWITPYTHEASFHLRLPDKFLLHVVDQFLVVALAEEFFYRGYMQARLRDAWPEGRMFLGVRLGKAFWVTQVLFALGHLAEPYPWRLAVFFPALLFGWLRERTGTITAGTIFHALSNLTVLVLEASFFGR